MNQFSCRCSKTTKQFQTVNKTVNKPDIKTTNLSHHHIKNVSNHHVQSTKPPSSKYHITLFKIPDHHLKSATTSSKYTQSSSKYYNTLFKVPHHPLKSTTPPSSKYYNTLFKVPHHPLKSTTTHTKIIDKIETTSTIRLGR